MNDALTIICGDSLGELRKLPSESVQMVCTSPPYWGLRDYGTAAWEGGEACTRCHGSGFVGEENGEFVDPARCPSCSGSGKCDHLGNPLCSDKSTLAGYTSEDIKLRTFSQPFRDRCGKCGARRIDSQLGLEKTPEEYVARMIEVFREVKRLLRRDGTLWLNLGSSMASGGRGGGMDGERGEKQRSNTGALLGAKSAPPGFKLKDMVPIPWMVAMALQKDGWWLRQDIIWAKPNPMPESCTDRPTKSHEYIFLLTKSARYFYDAEAIREPELNPGASAAQIEYQRRNREGNEFRKGNLVNDSKGTWRGEGNYNGGRNKRSVWRIATQSFPEAHFATFPEEIPKLCILAGTSAKGCCAKCGAPWERIIEREKQPRGDSFGNRNGAFDHGQAGSAYQETVSSKTLGWQPTCKCEDWIDRNVGNPGVAATEPCTVLDPFAGSFTTCAVALELGRRAIGIELSPKYCDMGRDRCNVTPGLALA